MQDQSQPVPNIQILEEASGWFVDFHEGEVDAHGRKAFNRWLRRSPEHVRAYVEIAAAWEESARLHGRHGEAAELVTQALNETNVAAFPLCEPRTGAGAVQPSRRHVSSRLFFAAATAALLAVLGGWLYGQRQSYSTGIGEQRVLTLADGSVIEMNALSRVKIRFSGQARDVELQAGQALFQVAPDPARPFTVRSDEVRVRAVGTRFDVYRRSGRTIVTVVEGRVAVSTARSPGAGPDAVGRASSILAAGFQTVARSDAIAPPMPANLSSATAWTRRELVFDDTPLLEVIEEFNRYNVRRIVIEDPRLQAFHIRGTFAASQPGRLIDFLRDRFDLQIEENGGRVRISGK